MQTVLDGALPHGDVSNKLWRWGRGSVPTCTSLRCVLWPVIKQCSQLDDPHNIFWILIHVKFFWFPVNLLGCVGCCYRVDVLCWEGWAGLRLTPPILGDWLVNRICWRGLQSQQGLANNCSNKITKTRRTDSAKGRFHL